MASSRIKGITVEIGADTVKLTDALSKVDKSLKDTQSQLRDVNKLLKFDPKNTELLAQKQKLLNDAIADTDKKLKEERKALEQLVSKGDTSEEAIKQQNALKREIADTENLLKTYKKQLNDLPNALDRVADATGKAAEKTKVLSQTAGAIGVAMLGNAVNAGKTADELFTLSRNTGISVETLQEMQYASDLVDVSVDQMTGSLSKLTKQMGAGSKAFEEIGVNIYNTDGTLRDSEEVWYDTLQALSQIDNETERDARSMDIFGKSAMELSGIIDDGGAALKGYGQVARDTGLIMDEDMLGAAAELDDSLVTLKNTAQMSLAQAGASLAQVLLPALDRLIVVVRQVSSWLTSLDGETQKTILTILAVVASISPLLTVISKISSTLSTLKAGIGLLSSPIGIAVLAITGLIAAGVLLYQHWDELKAYAQQLKDNLIMNFTTARDSIVGAFQTIIQWAIDLPARIGTGILETIGLALSAASQLGQGIIDKIAEFFDNARQVGSDLIGKVKDGIDEAFSSIGEFLTGIGSAIVDGIWSGISGAVGKFTENVRGFFSGIVNTVKRDLQIASPSKVFTYIGEMMGEGLVQGWDDSISSFDPSADIMAVSGGAALASGAAGGNSYGFTNNINLYGAYHERDGMNIAMSIDKWLGERI